MKILYITIGEMGNRSIGSGLRPSCMYRAFLERGHTVYTVSGHDGRGEGKLRAADVKKAKAWAKENRPDLCYIESTTYPMLHACDYGMFRFLHKNKIPTAYFYRDFPRRFPEIFPRRTGLPAGLKEMYLDWMQARTDRILRLADIVYFPSEACFPLFSYRNMRALPPAGELHPVGHHAQTNTCIYVGGISERYGYRMLLEAFSLLNQGDTEYRLILVCRENEYLAAEKPEPVPEWLEIHHVSGQELEPLYQRADIGLIALQPNAYAELAICVKLFQYLGYGLPVLSTDVTAMRQLICGNGFGAVAPYDAAAYADAIRNMLADGAQLHACRDAAVQSLTEKHLWVHRVDQVVRDLCGEGDRNET